MKYSAKILLKTKDRETRKYLKRLLKLPKISLAELVLENEIGRAHV